MKHRSPTLYSITITVALLSLAAAQTGPEPGTTDPMGKPSRYFLLRSDEVFAPGILGNIPVSFNDLTFFPDANLNLPQSSAIAQARNDAPEQYSNYDPQMWAASGRVLTSTHDQIVYARRTDSPGGWFGLFFLDRGSPNAVLSYYLQGLAFRQDGFTDFLALAIGDLDKVADSNGIFHDEVVVAYASPAPNNAFQVNVTVLDYTSVCSGNTSTIQPCAVTTAQTSNVMTLNGLASNTGANPALDVAIGDFDGNGLNEIAVAQVQDAQNLTINSFRYTNDGKGNRSLKQANLLALGPGGIIGNNQSGQFGNSLSLAAGDFNGDDIDELALGDTAFAFDSPESNTAYGQVVLCMLQSDVNLTFKLVGDCEVPAVNSSWQVNGIAPNMKLQIVSGLFKFDPASGYDFGRRQLAIAYSTPDAYYNASLSGRQVWLQAWYADTNLNLNEMWDPIQLGSGTDRFWIAAGGYRGIQDAQNPLWSVAYTLNTPDISQTPIGMVDVASAGIVQSSNTFGLYYTELRMPLVNYDYNGDSIYLGAPVHYTVDGAINTDFVLQEPPKHAYYDNNPNSFTYGQVVTVSRRDSFNVQLQDSNQTTFASTSTDTSSYDVGGSVSASASGTVKAGADIGIANVSAETTTSFSASASYDYKENQSSYDSKYGSRTVSFSGQTNRDDYLAGRTQIFDIWRYRIYGITTTLQSGGGATGNGYYEIVLPGPVENFAGGGLSLDWYQPVHENGNILSYPSQLGSSSPNLPDDLGAYTDTNGSPVQAPLVPASQQAFDGTSGTIGLQYSNTSGSGYIKGYSHNLKTSADVSRSTKVTAEAFGTGGTVQTSVKVGFNSSTSFGKSSTSAQTTNNSTGISLSKPAGNASQAYSFSPIFYITEDGTVKAAHAASVLGNPSGSSFWASIYGGKADPALNLPDRFNAVLSGSSNVLIGWQPNLGNAADTNSSRKQMRGFFLEDPNLNPVTGDYDYLAYAPAAGDQVRIEARVYNYSTGVAVNNLLVQFQAIPYNSNNDVETLFTSCPNALTLTAQGRCIIGQTMVGPLGTVGAGNVTSATITWDTTGFGPAQAGGSQQYRIYTVLDPNNTIDEIYESEDPNKAYLWVDISGKSHDLKGIDPGQNNEGYGYATIAAPGASLQSATPANVFLKADSLAAIDTRDGQPRSDQVRVSLHEKTRLRVTLYTDQSQREFNHVFIYDGNPSKGGMMLADKIVHAGNTNGASAWIDWIPQRLGRHTIFAQVVKDHDDPRHDNAFDVLKVQVVRSRPAKSHAVRR